MTRKKIGLERTGFEPPFYTPDIGANAYNIPEEYETLLIDIYTKSTEINPDILIEEIPNLLRNELNVPEALIHVNENEFKSWAIDGTNILDFEKWLYNGYFWLILSGNLGTVDMLWNDIWAALGVNDTRNDSNLRVNKLYLKDVKKLIEIGKLDGNAMGMLQTAGNGKVYIDYIDFFKLLGRLGVFE